MGSGFIAYAIMMTLILLVGEQWIRRIGKSPEFFDSWVITVWVRLLVAIVLRQEKLQGTDIPLCSRELVCACGIPLQSLFTE